MAMFVRMVDGVSLFPFIQNLIIDHEEPEEHEVIASKIFYFFMSFRTFMVKIKHFINFQKLTGWSMEVLVG
jgi:hypothetical protein